MQQLLYNEIAGGPAGMDEALVGAVEFKVYHCMNFWRIFFGSFRDQVKLGSPKLPISVSFIHQSVKKGGRSSL